jgi:putative phage-type endonuclease
MDINENFGIITVIFNKIVNILNKNINKSINFKNYINLKKQIFNILSKDINFSINDDTTLLNIIDEIFNRIFKHKYKLNNKLIFENGQNSFRDYEDIYPEIEIDNEYIDIENQFNKLKLLPQPVQRSKEWFDYRYNRITASDTAAAIDLNPYETVEEFILKKCDPNFPFRDNVNVFHGKKYEPIATMIYEHIYNTRVFEFGALPSKKYNFLGASPDGICSKYTLDNKFSNRIGTMLEIKCPVTRNIVTSGNIVGDICPFYYYCQVQQQLACCELDICDFWQCKLLEYNNKNTYLFDDCSSCINSYDNDNKIMKINDKLKKGVMLEFYPKKFIPEFDGDNIEWKSKYIIPKSLDMNEIEYDDWVIKMLDSYKILYPDIYDNYYFNKIIRWKLELTHNVSIKRDDNFLNNIIPILKNTWNKIVYYRENKDKLDELKKIINNRKKYIKFNTSYTIHNDIITKNKILFLDSNINLSTIKNN